MKTPLYEGNENKDLKKELQRENDFFAQFVNQRVKIKYSAQLDYFSGGGTMIGRIKDDGRGMYKFYEGRKRTRYRNLTLGAFDGWYATIKVLEIEPVTK